MFWNIFSLIIVAILWGATNPFIRRGSIGIEKVGIDEEVDNTKINKHWKKIKQFSLEIKFLFSRWQYLLPFLLNQTGSLLYIIVLQKTELSVAVPIANSLSFVFTAIVAILLGEKRSTLNTYIGMTFVIIGTTICMFDKINT